MNRQGLSWECGRSLQIKGGKVEGKISEVVFPMESSEAAGRKVLRSKLILAVHAAPRSVITSFQL